MNSACSVHFLQQNGRSPFLSRFVRTLFACFFVTLLVFSNLSVARALPKTPEMKETAQDLVAKAHTAPRAPRKPTPISPFPKRPMDSLRTSRVAKKSNSKKSAQQTAYGSAKKSLHKGSRKTAYQVVVLTEGEVAAHLRAAGFSERDVNKLTCTARFESGFNPRAKNRNTNGSQDSGLFQVNDVWLGPCEVTRAELFDPGKSARCAKKIHEAQGTRAWVAFRQRKHICDNYRVGDFQRKGLRTIRSIVEAAEGRRREAIEAAREPSRKTPDVSMASQPELL